MTVVSELMITIRLINVLLLFFKFKIRREAHSPQIKAGLLKDNLRPGLYVPKCIKLHIIAVRLLHWAMGI